MAKAGTIRGLQVFISDIRACPNRESEARRVDKELAKIRAKFGDDKKTLSAYDRKKYVWKLLYIYMLGYDVEFGHKQACDLIPAQKYSEKQVGYMACSILMNEKDEFLRLSINAIHSDLVSRNEAFQCLALTFVSNIAGPEMAEALTPDVLKLVNAGNARPIVRKKAALCLLRLLRKTPADQASVTADAFAPVMGALLEERDVGLLLSAATLLLGIVSRFGAAGYETCSQRVLRVLERLVGLRDITPDYTYYGIASPWLQVKCLRLLQYLPPPETPAVQRALHDVLQAIFNTCGEQAKSPTVNKANAQHAILFEAIALCLALDTGRDLLAASVGSLGRFLSVREPNVRYLALETLTRLVLMPDVNDAVAAHQATITANLKDPDVSIRRRALDLLFTMTDASNAVGVVGELVKYLTIADFSMREELVLKVAILAEKFAPDVQWYVDVALALLERAGDFCGEDIWHRVVQLVTNNASMQAYAAGQVVDVLRRGANHESLLCTAACVLGEYGKLAQPETPPLEMFRLLSQHLPTAPPAARGLLLSASLKLLLQAPGDAALRAEVEGALGRYTKSSDAELQQRAVEYLALAKNPAASAASFVLPMPKWEGRESTLLRRLQAQEGGDSDAASISSALTATASDADALAAAAGAAARPGSSSAPGRTGSGLGAAPSGPPVGGAPPAGSPSKRGAAAGPGSPLKGVAAAEPPAAAEAAAEPAAAVEAAAPAAAPAKAPVIDLLGDDDGLLPVGNGAPAATAAAAPLAAAAAAGAAAAPKAYDPLDDLFGLGPTPAPAAAAPAAGPAPAPPEPPAEAGPAAGASQEQPQPPQQQPLSPQYHHHHQQQQQQQQPMFGAPPEHNPFAPPPMAAPGPYAGATGGMPPMAHAPMAMGPYAGFTGAAPFAGPTGGAPFAGPTGGYPMPGAYPGAPPPGYGMPAPYGGAPEAPMVAGDVQQWYNALLLQDQGVLYEDSFLQCGLQVRYSGGRADATLFLGNKHAAAPLAPLGLAVAPPASGALHISMGQAPPMLAPKQQVQVALSALCLAASAEPPLLHLSYGLPGGMPGQALQVALRLPFVAHKFMAPEGAISKESFFATWKAFAGPPQKQQEMVERPPALGPLAVEAAIALLRGLNFGVTHLALDPNPHNDAGAAVFAGGPPGAEARPLCQVRLEGNPQNRLQFRVTVAAPDPSLAAAVKDTLAALIRTAAAPAIGA